MPATTSQLASKPTKAPSPAAQPPLRKRVAAALAAASGAFCLVLASGLVFEHFQHKRATHPLDHPRMIELKARLERQPQDEPLKAEIRALDLQLRRQHDRYLADQARGQWLLLGGMGVFLASLQTLCWRQKIARPGKLLKPAGWQAREIARSTAGVAVMGLAAGGLAWWLVHASGTMLVAKLAQPSRPIEPAAWSMPATPFPAPEEVARNWGGFRGPGGAGVSAFTNAPLSWNVQTGEGVLWKTKAPGPDFNSPVLWENRLFLTSATALKREVFCYEADSGRLLWQKAVERVPGGGAAVDMPEVSGGFAGPTAAADGRRVYAMFANGDLAAFTFNGEPAWSRSLAPITNQYGHASSLALWRDRLIVQLDHGEADQKVSRLIALNTADGQTAWERPRDTLATWSTPIVIEAAGKPQIITLGLPYVVAYSAADGAELWRAQKIEGEVTPSPIFAGGLVLAPSPSTKLLALRPDGSGDITKTGLAWAIEDGVPDITSPVSDGQRVYLLTTGGTLTCCNIQSGKKIWEQELELEFRASPVVAGDRLYLFGSKGAVRVVGTGDQYKELARSDFTDEIIASPAFADGRIYVRTRQSLYGLGSKPR